MVRYEDALRCIGLDAHRTDHLLRARSFEFCCGLKRTNNNGNSGRFTELVVEKAAISKAWVIEKLIENVERTMLTSVRPFPAPIGGRGRVQVAAESNRAPPQGQGPGRPAGGLPAGIHQDGGGLRFRVETTGSRAGSCA